MSRKLEDAKAQTEAGPADGDRATPDRTATDQADQAGDRPAAPHRPPSAGGRWMAHPVLSLVDLLSGATKTQPSTRTVIPGSVRDAAARASRADRFKAFKRRVRGWASAGGHRHHQADDTSAKPSKKVWARSKSKDEKYVKSIRKRLFGMGHVDRGLQELAELAATAPSEHRQRLAAKELVAWYANHPADADADRVRGYLDTAMRGEHRAKPLKEIAILGAELLVGFGDTAGARRLLTEAAARDDHADVDLGLANLETTPDGKAARINRVLARYGAEPIRFRPGPDAPYDRLEMALEIAPCTAAATPLVTVIMPTFNAAPYIGSAIRSILAQSWRDIELLVVDDASTDGSVAAARALAATDDRVRVIALQDNAGPYVARNVGLQEARGVYVTCNDADDWSHPRKIERQVAHLEATPAAIANTSAQARTFESMEFSRRGNPGYYIQPNLSSLMFRRAEVLDRIGYWDSVRFAGDSDFKSRMKTTFGDAALVDLDTGPLSFQRQTQGSLTGSSRFGYSGFKTGARLEYERQVQRNIAAGGLRMDFPQAQRPFPVPDPLRRAPGGAPRHFDVIIVSDFRLPGGSNASNAEEIKAQTRAGMTTGLLHLPIYQINADREMNEKVAGLVDGAAVEVVVYGEEVSCDILIIRHPWVLQDENTMLPSIKTRALRVIVNQPPKRDYGETGGVIYDIETCARRCEAYFGTRGIWHPIGPLVREALVEQHADELPAITLADEDWPNIIDVEYWRRPPSLPQPGTIRIGRHSRDAYVKWPEDADTLCAVYPDHPPYSVHVMGGAETPRRVLGRLPGNWSVHQFDAMPPRDFLLNLDVFVYFTHSSWVEAFGRVIIEAMAVGVPVVLPPHYRPMFGEAAVYAAPSEVKATIERLVADPVGYADQVARAAAYTDAQFGYHRHEIRLAAIREAT